MQEMSTVVRKFGVQATDFPSNTLYGKMIFQQILCCHSSPYNIGWAEEAYTPPTSELVERVQPFDPAVFVPLVAWKAHALNSASIRWMLAVTTFRSASISASSRGGLKT